MTGIPERIRELLADLLVLRPDEVRPEHLLVDDLDADSITFLELWFKLERDFGFDLPEVKADEETFNLPLLDGLARLEVKAPSDGVVNILPNYRSGSIMGAAPEFREGDRAWAGAAILELPDLSSVHLLARLDESDRSRLQTNQPASVRIEAVPGREFKAKIDSISMLARVDYQSSWPPPRNFDLDLLLLEEDARIRPGMTAVARIATERVADVILVPSEAIFQRDGMPVVYELDGSMFVERPVQLTRRGKDQAIVASGVEPGARIASRRPGPELIRRAQ